MTETTPTSSVERPDAPTLATILSALGALMIGGGLLGAFILWPRGYGEETAVVACAYGASGLVSGLLLFAMAEALVYMNEIRFYTQKQASILGR